MNLLTPTGSLMNNIAANSKQPPPEVGMGATELGYTDRHAATVIRVVSPTRIITQRDTATRADQNGMSESQKYTYEPNPDGLTREWTLRKNGRWVQVGQSMKNGQTLALGYRNEYFDYSF